MYVSVRKVSRDGVAGQAHNLRQWSIVKLNGCMTED